MLYHVNLKNCLCKKCHENGEQYCSPRCRHICTGINHPLKKFSMCEHFIFYIVSFFVVVLSIIAFITMMYCIIYILYIGLFCDYNNYGFICPHDQIKYELLKWYNK